MKLGEETLDELRNGYVAVGREKEVTVSTRSLRTLASRIRRENMPSEPKGRIGNFKPDADFPDAFFNKSAVCYVGWGNRAILMSDEQLRPCQIARTYSLALRIK